MKTLLLSTALAAVLLLPGGGANAAIIANLGVNPSSAQGDFSNSPGGGAFEDQFTFQLVGGPQFFTIGSVTNVFPPRRTSSPTSRPRCGLSVLTASSTTATMSR